MAAHTAALALSRTALRLRLRRVLHACARVGSVVGIIACAAAPFVAFAGLVALAIMLASALLAFALRVHERAAAQALDDAGALAGRMVAACELRALPTRTPFIEAALRDAEQHVRSVDLARAVPLRASGWTWLALASVALALSIPVRTPKLPVTAPPAPTPPEQAPTLARAEREALAAELPRQGAYADRVRALLSSGAGAEAMLAEARALSTAMQQERVGEAERRALHEALDDAREQERARREGAQSDAATEPPERELDQLQRPPEPPAASAEERAKSEQVLSQLRELLGRPPADDDARGEFEQAARGGSQPAPAGGGSEPDTGEHTAPGERRIGGTYEDHALRGVHGEGPSRSSVIAGASHGGFVSAPYQRVYNDYRAHAERALERDDIPSGERFYVRRYFQLVEPR